MRAKKIIGLLLLAFVVFFVVTNPAGASDLLKNIGSGLKNVAQSLTSFVQSIGS